MTETILNARPELLVTSELVDSIILHHAAIRARAAQLSQTFAKAYEAALPEAGAARSALDAWRRFARELADHQDGEERELLPSVRDVSECVRDASPLLVITRAALLDKMRHEHGQLRNELGAVRVLIAAIPADEPVRSEALVALDALAADLDVHFHLEDEVLASRLLSCLQ